MSGWGDASEKAQYADVSNPEDRALKMHAREHCGYRCADDLQRGNGHNRYDAGNQGIFDGRRAVFIVDKGLHKRSRNIGTSGISAGVKASCAMSFGITHLIAVCSSAWGMPSHRRQM